MNINAPVSAQNAILTAGTLNVGNTGGVYASNQLAAVVSGDVNITGGYLKTGSGDLEMLIGGSLNVGNTSYGGIIWGGYNQLSPYYPDVSIAVGGDVKLNNGAHINAANDVFIDLLGSSSKLVLNDGAAGYAPSYILSDIGTGVIGTTYLTLLNRTSGGIVIDGKESTTTVVGSSGFFEINLGTPALNGAGLDITYAAQANDSVAAALVNALASALASAADKASSRSPTESTVPPAPPEKQSSGDTSADGGEGTFGSGDSNGGSETASGSDEGGKGSGKDGKKDKKDKKSNDGKDGKKDEKSAKKKVGKCSA
jgi:hypothetical protein